MPHDTPASGFRLPAWLLWAVGVATPFVVVLLVPYRSDDLGIFRLWADCLARAGRSLYLDCPVHQPPNYPAAGIYASAGLLWMLRVVHHDGATAVRLALAAVDALNFGLFVALGRALNLRRPLWFGLAMLFVPSYLVGGALWGQIDHVALAFELTAILGLAASWSGRRWGWFAAAVMLPLFMLTKQLSLFALPFVTLLVGVTATQSIRRSTPSGLRWAALAAALCTAEFAGLDRSFALPGRWASSYAYSWIEGRSVYGDLISENGFNIWLLLGRPMDASAHARLAGLEPYTAGIALFLAWCGWLTWTAVARLRHCFHDARSALPMLLLFNGLCVLGMNVWLTGTADRYMFAGYPFLLAGAVALRRQRLASGRTVVLCFAAATAYGAFVFSRIGPLPGVLGVFGSPMRLAAIHLALLVTLAIVWMRLGRAAAEPFTT